MRGSAWHWEAAWRRSSCTTTSAPAPSPTSSSSPPWRRMPTRRQACPCASKSRARSPEGAALSAEVALEPGDRELAHVRERAGLFEQVPRAGDDDQLVMCAQELRRVPIELEHLRVA